MFNPTTPLGGLQHSLFSPLQASADGEFCGKSVGRKSASGGGDPFLSPVYLSHSDGSTRLHVSSAVAPSGPVAAGLSNPHISALGVKSFSSPPPLPVKTHFYRRHNSIEKVGVKDSGATTKFHIGASLVECSRPSQYSLVSGGASVGGGNRSYVSGFSASSRRRLLLQLSKVRRDAVPIFVTLTYPNSWPSQPKEWKRHLDNFRRVLLRRFPGCSMIWKLEAQRRGAPHFHVFIFGVDVIDVGFRSWLSETWYRVVGSNDEKHLRAGTRVEYLRSIQGAFNYAAKYMGKTVHSDESWQRPGRFWGVYGRENLPVGEVFIVPLSWLESVDLQRYLRRYAGLRGSSRPTLRCFVGSPEQWLRVLDIVGQIPTGADPP